MIRTVFSGAAILAAVTLSSSYADETSKDGNLAGLVQLLAEVDDVEFQRDLLAGMHKALNGRRNVAMPTGWSKVSGNLLQSKDPEVRRQALQLGVIFGDSVAMKTLRGNVINTTLATAERQHALQSLVQKQEDSVLPLLEKLLDDPAMRSAAIRAYAAYKDPGTPKRLLSCYEKLSPAERRDVIHTLSSRPNYAVALLNAVKRKQIPTRDVSAFVIRQMTALGDKRLTQQIREVWGDVRPTATDRAARIAAYRKRLTADVLKKANRSHGRQLFRKTCASCHRLFDDGKRIGPELTGSQRNNVDYLLENLIDPNAVIGRDYRMTILVTDAGRILTGIIKEETAKTVTLQTANEVVVVDKSDIELRKRSPVSLMPEGQLEKMPFSEVVDLFGYLMGADQVPLPGAEKPAEKQAKSNSR